MRNHPLREKARSIAKKAIDKKSPYGPDVDLSKYLPNLAPSSNIDFDNPNLKQKLLRVGVDVEESRKTGGYYQVDSKVLEYYSKIPGIEIISLEEAIEEFGDLLEKYYWRAVPVDKDKYTAVAELYGKGGYVIIAKRGSKIPQPISTCLLVYSNNVLQAPHNIVVVEDGAELHIVTGCTVMREVSALHAGVSEFYVGKKAKLTFTMIHGWSMMQHVRPRTGVVVDEGGEFISHYITMAPSRTLQTMPVVRLVGDDAKAHLSSVVVGGKNALLDVGGMVELWGAGTSGEIISRVLGKDRSINIARARLEGVGEKTRGHIECMGLLLSDDAVIKTVPELEARTSETSLTHEASIGKIAEDEILYLVARGFNRDEATSMIVRGFLNIRVEGLPRELQKAIEYTINLVSRGL